MILRLLRFTADLSNEPKGHYIYTQHGFIREIIPHTTRVLINLIVFFYFGDTIPSPLIIPNSAK